MAADAIPVWVAVGHLLLFGFSVIYAYVLARRGVRDGGKVVVKVKLLPPTCYVSVAGANPANQHGERFSTVSTTVRDRPSIETVGRRDEDSENQEFREQQ